MKNSKPKLPDYTTNLQRSAQIVKRRMVELHDKIEREGLRDEAAIACTFMILCTQIGDLASDIEHTEELNTQARIADLKLAEDMKPNHFFVERRY